MQARGVPLIVLAVCGVASGCGGDEPTKPDASAAGEDSNGGAEPVTDGGSGAEVNGEGGSGAKLGGGETGGAGGADSRSDHITFSVVGDSAVHPISPLIYGANMDGVDCSNPKARFTFCRHRSSAWSTYNWENNASNAGASDCNENNDALSAISTPAAAVTGLIDAADAVGASTVVTVPMLDHVAADKDGGSAAPTCSGDVANTADYLTTRFKQNRPRLGAAFPLAVDTSDEFVSQDEFLAYLRTSYADSSLLFSLDTQMELWSEEHPRLRAEPLTYDEEVALSVDYSKMIKDSWPGAEVLGLLGYGYLAALNQQASAEYDSKGEFFSYYLTKLKQASDGDDRRLIDYVDLHWFPELYPDAQRVIGEETGPASVASRVQAPRSLWDPDFVEDSWITQTNGGQPIELLTWLHESIDASYPGTKLALSEWSYGGGEHISGAIAAADALGIYGQQGLGLAGVVSFSPDEEPYLIGAFQAYRNYDGEGQGFGDTSVFADSSDVERASIYASIDQSDTTRMVLVAINRHDSELTATLAIDHDVGYQRLTPYAIVDGQPEPTLGAAIEATAENSFELTLPAYSVWVLVPSE